MKVDGRCLCGHLTYEAEVDPDLVSICHCVDCQVLSGSAFRVTVPVTDGSFRFLSGAPKTYVKTAASGSKRILAFCPECGTSIYSKPADGKSGYFGLRVGSATCSCRMPNIGAGRHKAGLTVSVIYRSSTPNKSPMTRGRSWPKAEFQIEALSKEELTGRAHATLLFYRA